MNDLYMKIFLTTSEYDVFVEQVVAVLERRAAANEQD
jgi:hypothetical protein